MRIDQTPDQDFVDLGIAEDQTAAGPLDIEAVLEGFEGQEWIRRQRGAREND